ncbi:MAG: type I restriction endonuclease subunit R, partial [Firmicutes bacterium]|nr:type I restriction endonuclease subunit R [Bacillota bacterium]
SGTTPDLPTNILVAKTKLAGTQRIDAGHILSLIGSKATTSAGKQTVDAESLRILYQQIQELSNMGEFEEAELLKEFVNEELKPGNIESGINFDDAFESWKQEKRKKHIYEIAREWGASFAVLERAVDAYSLSHPDEIPFIDELIGSVDFASVKDKKASNQLEHSMMLNEYLDEVIPKIKVRYK